MEETDVSAVVLTDDSKVLPGQYAFVSGTLMSVPTGDSLLGRIVNPLGTPVDDKGPLLSQTTRMVESVAPSIISRSPVIYLLRQV